MARVKPHKGQQSSSDTALWRILTSLVWIFMGLVLYVSFPMYLFIGYAMRDVHLV